MRVDPARPGSVAAAAILAGLVAGLVAALFLTVAGEPAIEAAIRIEEARADPASDHGDEVVSRDVQRGVGLFVAYGVTGAGFGLLFATAFAAQRRGGVDPLRRSLVAGAVLAGALTVSPWLKYPPNPPAVGDPATLGQRQWLYLAVILLTLVVAVGAVRLGGRLQAAGWDPARRAAAVAAAVAVPLLAAYAALPGAPDPVDAPATLVWRFRVASLGGNLLLWAVLTLVFAVAATRGTATRGKTAASAEPHPAPA